MIDGSIVALVTPFNEQKQLDVLTLEALVKWHIEEGTKGLVLCGSTGEGSLLTKEEKCTIFHLAKKWAKGQIFLIANVGSNDTKESGLLAKEAKDIGMDACLATTPYYVRPTVEGCYQHFQALAKIGLPIVFYHNPARTGIKLRAFEIAKICTIPQIVAIKEASADLGLGMELVQELTIPIFSGDDLIALAQLSIGFKGSISVLGNLLPRRWHSFVASALEGNLLEARALFFSMYALCQAMGLEPNPQCIKYALSKAGKCLSGLRLPLIEPIEENQKKIQEALLLSESLYC